VGSSKEELEARLKPKDRKVTMDREWNQDDWGLNPECRRACFGVLLSPPVGGGDLLLLRKVR
jgi:hypothetical protein